MPKPSVSLAIICLNEAQGIERCIRSVPFATEVIVVDSGSTDGTKEIAARLGAKVIEEKWRGYRDQKRFAVEKCTSDWVLSLDGDEAMSAEAAHEVEELLKNPAELDQYDGFEFPRLSWNLGRWIRHGGWYPDRQLRLFHRERAKWEGGEHVHERIQAARVKRLKSPLLHWPFPTHSEQVQTNNRYSSLGAEELKRRGKKPSVFMMAMKPWSKFIETYFIKRGFLDGVPGFIIAVGAAYSIFLKFAKHWEAANASKPPADDRKPF